MLWNSLPFTLHLLTKTPILPLPENPLSGLLSRSREVTAWAVYEKEQTKDIFDQLRDAYQSYYPETLSPAEHTIPRAMNCGLTMMKIIPHASAIALAGGAFVFTLAVLAFKRKKVIVNVITPPPQVKESNPALKVVHDSK
jgi:hypothetical protein